MVRTKKKLVIKRVKRAAPDNKIELHKINFAFSSK